MPLQNRVTPEGAIVASSARGTMMGNRGGCFHRPDRTLGRRRWSTRQWICCVLDFKGRRRAVMAPGRYTELFFLDEATALAAGHRPCFECRRADADHFAAAWATVSDSGSRPSAPAMDRELHAERLASAGPAGQRRARPATLPDGTLVREPRGPALVLGGLLRPWSLAGYGSPYPPGSAQVLVVLTPPTIVAILAAGYRAGLHPTARS